jgi:hypothetical protein
VKGSPAPLPHFISPAFTVSHYDTFFTCVNLGAYAQNGCWVLYPHR